MTIGIAFMEGTGSPRDTLRHASMIRIDRGSDAYFDYRGGAVYTVPEPEAGYEYGVYWPLSRAKMLQLNSFLAQLCDLDPHNMQFRLAAPPARQISQAFNDALDLGFASDQLLVNCVNILGVAAYNNQIASPYEPLNVGEMTELTDIQNAARTMPPQPGTWQPAGQGKFVLNSPNVSVPHREAVDQLKFKAAR